MKVKATLFLMLAVACSLQAQIIHLPSSVYLWEGFERNLARRVSCYPYLSGDTFRAFCDHIFDETKTYIDVDAIQPGDTIFLVADMVPYFFQEVYKHIKHPFVIVTHNRDDSMPGDFVSYLDDEKIIAWFAVNTDTSHQKLFAIPIGLANSYWPHGKSDVVKKQSMISVAKNILLYASHITLTHETRKKVYACFKNKPFCHFAQKKPHDQYLLDLKKSKFVLSPRGNGLDCHRTWEALYMGAIPVVPATTINSVYEGLPVVIVDDWATVTAPFLEQKWAEHNPKLVNLERIFADYWFDLISQHQNSVRSH